MEQMIEQLLQYCMPVLEQGNRYLRSIPPEYLWGAAILLAAVLICTQIIRFLRSRRTVETQKPASEAVPSDERRGGEAAAYIREATEPELDERASAVETAAVPDEPSPPAAMPQPESFFTRLKSGLSKTRNTFSGGLDRIFSGARKLDDDTLEELEELLITSDVGVRTTMNLVSRISEKSSEITDAASLKQVLQEEILTVIRKGQAAQEESPAAKPRVVMVVGVNGVGKTTTIGKLAARFKEQGKKVLIVAADTFRAAAGEQLAIWAEKSGAQMVKHRDGADPASVAYDGVEAAIARGIDVVLVDTAGRLHTKVNLMEELKKIRRTIAKKLPEAPHEILMVLDATTGQNALTQARLFHDAMGLTSIALTKLDGTAKGGIVIGIADELNIPLRYVGVGEKIDDLQQFNPEEFVEALF